MVMDPNLQQALGAPSALLFIAVEVQLPGGVMRLLDGASEVSFLGRTFVGADPARGVLADMESFSDGIGAEAPQLRLIINPPSNVASATLASPAAQGSTVTVWLGALHLQTGQVLGAPEVLFQGEVDQPLLRVSKGRRQLTLDCVSAWERFFDDEEGVRLNNASHQNFWPGERGLEHVTDILRQMPWGSDAPRPGVVTDSGSQSPTVNSTDMLKLFGPFRML